MLTRLSGKSGPAVSAPRMGCRATGGPWQWAQPGETPFPAGWCLDERMVPIPGFKTVARVEESARAMAFGLLTEEQVQQVQAIVAEHEQGGRRE